MLVRLHPDNPQERGVSIVAQCLNDDGVIVFPTDTVYAVAAKISSKKGFETICRIKEVNPRKALFSMIALDINQASGYLAQISTPHFRLLKRNLPGPFTFILPAGKSMPSHARSGRKTIGLRIPDHEVSRAIVRSVGEPLIAASLRSVDEILEYYNDPEEIYREFGNIVDCVVDAGPGTFYPSTVVDLTGGDAVIVRQGKAELA